MDTFAIVYWVGYIICVISLISYEVLFGETNVIRDNDFGRFLGIIVVVGLISILWPVALIVLIVVGILYILFKILRKFIK